MSHAAATVVPLVLPTPHAAASRCPVPELAGVQGLAARAWEGRRARDAQAAAPSMRAAVARLLRRLLFATPRARRPEPMRALRGCDALQGASEAALQAFAQAGVALDLEAGESIPADRTLVLVASGCVERVVGVRRRVAERLDAGALHGLQALVQLTPDGARLRAVQPTWVFCVSIQRLHVAMRRDRALARELATLLTRELSGAPEEAVEAA
ncbi:MAG: hypothetical protein H6741_33175 [Alphaproteobacteria bacterium]|nr:hypothetical protein [Alphaproteobacteria bacterium]